MKVIKIEGLKGKIILDHIRDNWAYIKWFDDAVELFPIQEDNTVHIYGLVFKLSDFKEEK